MAGNRNGERNYNERHQLNGKHEQSYSWPHVEKCNENLSLSR
jgi:hypothetical protein